MRLTLVALIFLGLAACDRAAEAQPPKTATLIAMAAPAAQAEDGAGAETFVRALYASYADGDDARPWSGDRVWSARMNALVRRDAELATEDLPYLDADPICDCQDWERLAVRAVALSPVGADGSVEATVRFVNGGEDKTALLKLKREADGWRVDDVMNPGHPSLAQNLAESNARIEAGRKALDRD
ncbi:MAG: DUF3828 domain-containing protein [Brevundimonas sp.]|uniref:DUF3828 domain-containing protein n=1 Tax=Brevundimonas sp. TaxID=1871086 RepID=UPI0025C1E52D|nr:DUF3828 domain-containing protein [Brevundimonas sp.]MBX3477786.1 DUF3828 domain-containing protein [Brevundimonas sp.]